MAFSDKLYTQGANLFFVLAYIDAFNSTKRLSTPASLCLFPALVSVTVCESGSYCRRLEAWFGKSIRWGTAHSAGTTSAALIRALSTVQFPRSVIQPSPWRMFRARESILCDTLSL